MIDASALVDKFKYALDNKWGYIWGTSGVQWTQAKQTQKVNYMISNFGENWKKNKDAKDNKYYSSALYGEKWIGHVVADCSGLFVWAFKQLNGAIAHGSNSIYDRYCSSKGKLSSGKRTDGKTLLVGTAVFTGDSDKKPHIGLYCGNGKVIEASGTVSGVCVSNINAGKWTYWGELKHVSYAPASDADTDAYDNNQTQTTLPTLRKGSKGEYVTLLQTKLKNAGYNLGSCGIDGDFGSATLSAVKQFQKEHGLDADGIVGKKTWDALEHCEAPIYYSVVIPHLTAKEAETVMALYKGAYKEREAG